MSGAFLEPRLILASACAALACGPAASAQESAAPSPATLVEEVEIIARLPGPALKDRVAADWAKELKIDLAKPGKVMAAADLDSLIRKGGLLDQLKAEGLEVIGPAY